jgi:ABC-type sugar transport system substrate-binding protein
MKRTKKFALALAAAGASLLLASCSAAGTGSAGGGEKGALAMTFAGLDIQIWVDEIDYMKPIIEEAGYEFLTNDPGWDIQTQVADVETWIQRGDVKAIMAYPVQSDSMVVAAEKALAAEIPMIGYAVKWDGIDHALVIDNYTDGLVMGQEAGDWIVENYGTSTAVPITLFSYWDNDLGRDRTEGALQGLKDSGANVSINEIPALTLDDGYAAVQSALSANPDTKVFVSISGDAMAGGYQALMDHGVAEDDPEFLIASLDATSDTLDAVQVKDSIWRLSYILPAKALAEANARMLIAAAEGKLDGDVEMSSTKVTAQNATEFYVKK